MASGIPKRALNTKKKEKRARSWAKNQEAKKERIAKQKAQEEKNRKLGTTGKQRANTARKVRKAIVDLNKSTIETYYDSQELVQEDLLEM
jgi:hypothetical protein